MYRLAKGDSLPLKYEDIVVRAFELFPDEFALRGYPNYPDSSDIHKPLYGPLKRNGYIRNANKTFSLTGKGVEAARCFYTATAERTVAQAERLDRGSKLELDRMLISAAFRFYRDGQPEKILDTDFYAFIGVTVRTTRNEFIGRLRTAGDAIKLGARLAHPDKVTAKKLFAAWRDLQERFTPEIQRRKEKEGTEKP